MDPRISTVLRLLFVGIALLVGGMFAMKQYRIHQEKGELVSLVRELSSEASFYRQFDREGAEGVLLKAVAAVEDARELGLPLDQLLDRVYERKPSDNHDYRSNDHYPIDEQLVRRTLDHAYRAANDLGLLESRHLKELRDGYMPRPDGGRPVILPLIDPEVSPGLEKVVANLEIRPPGSDEEGRELDAVEIAAARELARDLADADVIEDSVAERILEHYKTPKAE